MPRLLFCVITALLQNPKVSWVQADELVHRHFDVEPDAIAGLDTRGFSLDAVVAYELNVGLVSIRDQGKLHFTTVAERYNLEYGSAAMELRIDELIAPPAPAALPAPPAPPALPAPP